MTKIDYDWVKAQFAASKVRQGTGDTVLALLKVWEDTDFPNFQARDDALHVFSELAKDRALVEPKDETWVAARGGFRLQVGDIVRVYHSAYDGEAGRTHNGRRGRVLAIRSGDVIFRSTDERLPYQDGVHHPITMLEKLIR